MAMRPNARLIQSTMTGALGGLLFGIDITVISGAIDNIVKHFALSGVEQGFTVAIGPIGTVLGCFIGGVAGQRLGSRTALRYAAALYVLAALGSTFSPTWAMLLIMRLLSGLGLGSASVL